MINLSFNQGVFLNMLKIAHVIHIHKNSDKLDLLITADLFSSSPISTKFMKNQKK